jgi:hypothetical protein
MFEFPGIVFQHFISKEKFGRFVDFLLPDAISITPVLLPLRPVYEFQNVSSRLK